MAAQKRSSSTDSNRKSTPVSVKYEAVLWGVLAFSLVLFISNFGIAGKAGNFISSIFFGLFGMIAYIFPLMLFAGTAFMIANRNNTIAMIKVMASVVFVLFLCMFLELIGGDRMGGSPLDAFRWSVEHKYGGGLFGGLLTWMVRSTLGTVSAYIIDIIVMIICMILITERSLWKKLQSGGKKMYVTAKKETVRQKEHYTERQMRRVDNKISGVSMDTSIKNAGKAGPSDAINELRPDSALSIDFPIHLMGQEQSAQQHNMQEGVRQRAVVGMDFPLGQGQPAKHYSGLADVRQNAASGMDFPLSQGQPAQYGVPDVRQNAASGMDFPLGQGQPAQYGVPDVRQNAASDMDFPLGQGQPAQQLGGAADVRQRTATAIDGVPGALDNIFPITNQKVALQPNMPQPDVAQHQENDGDFPAKGQMTSTSSAIARAEDILANTSDLFAEMLPDIATIQREREKGRIMETESPGREWTSICSVSKAAGKTSDDSMQEADAGTHASEPQAYAPTAAMYANEPQAYAPTAAMYADEPQTYAPGTGAYADDSQADDPAAAMHAGVPQDSVHASCQTNGIVEPQDALDTYPDASMEKDGLFANEAADIWDDLSELTSDISGMNRNLQTGNMAGGERNKKDEKNNTDDKFSEIQEAVTQVKRDNPKQTAAQAAAAVAETAVQISQSQAPPKRRHVFPVVDLLKRGDPNRTGDSRQHLQETALKLQQTLKNFGVNVTILNVSCGPSVTRYEIQPEMGVKVSKIVNLSDDIKLNLAAADIRIEAPIPGKPAIGIEVPNKENVTVMFRDLIEAEEFQKHKSPCAFAVGKDIAGQVVVTDICKMPHLLIAGATGAGKSVCINTIIMSILYKAAPEDVKLIMIDPKVVELSVYNGIPHLLLPVVTDPKKAAGSLHWAVSEMDDRYGKFTTYGVRDIEGYNAKIRQIASVADDQKPEKMPYIIIIIDELADLMMVAPGDMETAICRLAQKARAAGIHLIIATQRPSVNVITGLIKANMPSRIAFSVTSGIDSRTILDMNGAEKLLGKGDMLFYPQGLQKPVRVQGAFVSDPEVLSVVEFLTAQNGITQYDRALEQQVVNASADSADSAASSAEDSRDAYFADAARLLMDKEKASVSMLQRYFKIGFNRAARIMDQLEEAGVVGPEEGTKPRKILMSPEQFAQYEEECL